jgi:hypothetical protein
MNWQCSKKSSDYLASYKYIVLTTEFRKVASFKNWVKAVIKSVSICKFFYISFQLLWNSISMTTLLYDHKTKFFFKKIAEIWEKFKYKNCGNLGKKSISKVRKSGKEMRKYGKMMRNCGVFPISIYVYLFSLLQR